MDDPFHHRDKPVFIAVEQPGPAQEVTLVLGQRGLFNDRDEILQRDHRVGMLPAAFIRNSDHHLQQNPLCLFHLPLLEENECQAVEREHAPRPEGFIRSLEGGDDSPQPRLGLGVVTYSVIGKCDVNLER